MLILRSLNCHFLAQSLRDRSLITGRWGGGGGGGYKMIGGRTIKVLPLQKREPK